MGKDTDQNSMVAPKCFYVRVFSGSHFIVEFDDRGAGRWVLQSRKVFLSVCTVQTFKRSQLICCCNAAKYDANGKRWFLRPMSKSNLRLSDIHVSTSSAISWRIVRLSPTQRKGVRHKLRYFFAQAHPRACGRVKNHKTAIVL